MRNRNTQLLRAAYRLASTGPALLTAVLLALAVSSPAADDKLAPIPLIPSALGPYTWRISTDDERAQAFFDQGMQLRYGYSMPEAARSMAEARRIDPDCAICFWGEAFALGSFLNRPMTEENARLAHIAISRAAELTDGIPAVEADLIRAAVQRYPADFDPDERREIDEAFAAAMAEVHAKYPEHPEVTTVYSIALFLLEERRGHRDLMDPDLQKLHGLLRSVIRNDPAHPGACHLYIHATESTSQPELGLPCAETLGPAVPGASHIQHMPSHTWNEVGLWRRSVRANLLAWKADRAALNEAGFSYGPSHNLHMLVFASSFDGQGAVAIQAGDDYEGETGNPIYAVLTRLRFGRFDEILQHKDRPDAALDAAFHDFARGYALLRTGDRDGAVELRDAVQAYAVDTEDRFRFHDAGALLGALGHILAGEILRSEGNLDAAITEFREAVRLEDSLAYDEPEPLPFAPRHWLGAALLEAGETMEAELVYRTELADHPHNGWSLFGLKQALDAQGRHDEMVDLDLAASWGRADVSLSASRF
jgi:tetratricopeptide (TPR) repeat protein